MFGKQHETTLQTKHNYAVTLNNMARYEEAEQLFLEVIAMRRQIFGEKHEKTLASKQSYGLTQISMGRLFKGLKLLF